MIQNRIVEEYSRSVYSNTVDAMHQYERDAGREVSDKEMRGIVKDTLFEVDEMLRGKIREGELTREERNKAMVNVYNDIFNTNLTFSQLRGR